VRRRGASTLRSRLLLARHAYVEAARVVVRFPRREADLRLDLDGVPAQQALEDVLDADVVELFLDLSGDALGELATCA